jgi:alkanesulfonate monooxygenase SsuD/methylene tetrahydromethanopterin reductase-like flavin-dependent oxidoreductase (luciferase family)
MNWPNSRDIVTTADRAGFEALVPVARWKGFGGATNFNGTCYETLTWAAGMGAVTNHASIFCTTHVPTIHPIVAAKQCTTVAKPPSPKPLRSGRMRSQQQHDA